MSVSLQIYYLYLTENWTYMKLGMYICKKILQERGNTDGNTVDGNAVDI